MRFYWEVLRSITPVSFPLSGKERRLAVSCVPIPRGSGSPLVRSHDFVRLSDLFGSLLACAFLYGDPDGVRGNAETRDTGNGVGGAVCVRLCVNLLALPCFPRGVRWGLRAPKPAPKSLRLSGLSSFDSWQSTFCTSLLDLPCFPQGERWGLRAPKPAPKSLRLSGLSSFGSRQSTSLPNLAITDISEQSRPRPATLGYTERPDRLQFMAGQVGLYSTKFSCFARQQVEPALPASRPQAARSRFACAKRSGSGSAAGLRTRSGVSVGTADFAGELA